MNFQRNKNGILIHVRGVCVCVFCFSLLDFRTNTRYPQSIQLIKERYNEMKQKEPNADKHTAIEMNKNEYTNASAMAISIFKFAPIIWWAFFKRPI